MTIGELVMNLVQAISEDPESPCSMQELIESTREVSVSTWTSVGVPLFDIAEVYENSTAGADIIVACRHLRA